jgi:hypothetical protein
VLTVVAVRLIEVPITVLETFVPRVVVEFSAAASGVLIPTPLNEFNTLASAIVAVYPEIQMLERILSSLMFVE